MPLLPSIVLSLLLAGTGVALFRRARASIPVTVAFGILLFLSFALYLLYGVSDAFTGDGITDAVVYHLWYGMGGAGFSDYLGLITATACAIVAGLVLSFVLPAFRKKRRPPRPLALAGSFALVIASIAPNPAIGNFSDLFFSRAAFSDEFRQYYIRPWIRNTEPQTKNLVFIWAEGFERTYFDEELFPGLVTGLRKLESEGTSFTNINQVAATGYTIAGIIASQCGIPLLDPFHGNRMASMDAYLPGAIGLGDLLHQSDYHLAYYGGAILWFAGKGKFFTTHKFDEVHGKESLSKHLDDPSYQTAWGLYDDSLFGIAYERFLELSEADANFGMFLLTLDTHHPNGHASRSVDHIVYGDGSNPMLNAVAASDALITNFVYKIRNSEFGDNTVIVIASDHLALRNAATDLLGKGERRNLFLILEPEGAAPAKIDTRGSTLDIAPTLLPFLGFEGAIGLGRNLLDENLDPSEIEFIHDDENLRSWAGDFARLWSFPRIKESIDMDLAESTMTFGGRTFDMPALVKVNEKFETIIEFPFTPDGSDKTLVGRVRRMREGTKWIWIDECRNISDLHQSVGEDGWCVVSGTGPDIFQINHIPENTSLSKDEIRDMINIRRL